MKLTLKRDRFTAPNRMTHTFDETAQINDPLGRRTFTTSVPNMPKANHTAPLEVQRHGENCGYYPPRSPVSKARGGLASISGPELDDAAIFARPFPTGTKRRIGPPKTDK